MRWVLPWLDRGSKRGVDGGGDRGGRRRLQALVALAAVALVMLGAAAAAQASDGSIKGTVTNHEAKPVKEVKVRAVNEAEEEFTATTVINGEYSLPNLPEGHYTVDFSEEKEIYLSKSEPEYVEGGIAEELNVVLTKASSFAGHVTSAATGAGLGGVSVEIYGPESATEPLYHSATTEASGSYAVKHLEPGLYQFYVFSGGSEYIAQSFAVDLGEGEEHPVNVKLSEGGKITGTVTNAYTHAGLEKISVYAYIPEHGGAFASTNSKGEYTITGLSSGVYDVEYSWEYSKAEEKEYEKAPAYIPKYITQYYNNQTSAASANTVSVSEGNTTSGINVGMLPSAPHNTAAPAVTGTALVGDALMCSNGSWTGEGMLSVQSGWPLTTPFGYQWLREGSAISGATFASYVVQSADEGHGLACEVTATNAAGHEASKSSSLTVPVPAIAASTSRLVFVKDTAKASIACANAACAGAAEVTARVAAKHGRKRTVVIAKGTYSLAAGTHGTVALRLTGPGAKAMLAARHRTLSGKLTISVKVGKTLARTVLATLAKK
jgi:hypothetical protein